MIFSHITLTDIETESTTEEFLGVFTGFEVGLVRVRFVVDTMTGMGSSTNTSGFACQYYSTMLLTHSHINTTLIEG